MQTMQQRRAKHALDQVKAHAKSLQAKQQSDYRAYAAALPAMIHTNGLGQAAAFYNSKPPGDVHRALYQLLSVWLTKPGQPYQGQDDLLEAIVAGDMHSYRLAQAEAQALMEWVVSFSRAFMTKGGAQQADADQSIAQEGREANT